MKLRSEDGLDAKLPENSGVYAAISPYNDVLYVGMASHVAETITRHELSPWLRLVPHTWVAKAMPYSELQAERKLLMSTYSPPANGHLGRPIGRRPKWIKEIIARAK